MARRQPRKPGAYGPYLHRQRWRIHLVDERGETTYASYATEAEAKQVLRSLRRELGGGHGKTIGQAIDEYEVYLRDKKQNKANSYAVTVWRLRIFFTDLDLCLADLDQKKCLAYYDALTKRVNPRTQKVIAVDSQRNILAEAKTFGRWCVEHRYLRANPVETVKGVGRRRHGKAQLRIDEARRWMARAVELADQGEDGAVAAMVTLLMGMRASEVVSRVVRDLDDNGRLLWIPDAKTEAGKRTLEVPEVLGPYLQRLGNGKLPTAPLFGHHWRDWPRKWVQKICADTGVPRVTAHGMRGLHSTLALARGTTGHVVAASLGHESLSTTLQSYADPGAVSAARQQTVLKVLEGTGEQGR